MLQHTTQNLVLPPSSFLRKHFRSNSPYRNILHRCAEYGATDMIYSNVPCSSTGVTRAHLFAGSSSKLLDAYGAKDGSEDVFLTVLQSRCVTRVVPTKLVADNAPMYRGSSIAKYLLDMFISLWQCKSRYTTSPTLVNAHFRANPKKNEVGGLVSLKTLAPQ